MSGWGKSDRNYGGDSDFHAHDILFDIENEIAEDKKDKTCSSYNRNCEECPYGKLNDSGRYSCS